MPTKRLTNFELLRIISMFLIILYHGERSIIFPDIGSTPPIWIVASKIFLGSWGLLGVDLFLIISAWFMVDQHFRIKKIVNILFQTITYIIGFAIAFPFYEYFLYHSIPGAIGDLCYFETLKITQPFWSEEYWFVTAYFFMLLSSPILNRIINSIQKKQLKKYLLLFAFIPFFSQFNSSTANDIIYFLYVYLLVGYIKRYKVENTYKKYIKPQYIISIVCLLFLIEFSKSYTNKLPPLQHLPFEIIYAFICIRRHSFFVLVLSLLIFLQVQKMKPFYNKTINAIASYTLGIYLFHENPSINVCDLITEKMVEIGYINCSFFFPIQFLLTGIIIFLSGLFVEVLRYHFIHTPLIKKINQTYYTKFEMIDQWFQAL